MKKHGMLMITLWVSLMTSSHAAIFSILDKTGKPLTDIVVVVKHSKHNALIEKPDAVKMSQQSRQFEPHVLLVQQNTPISFPNDDDITHHVYSFSPAKQFEQFLEKGDEKAPLIFEKAGVIELGCNVHDWMMGYIYVADSPYYGMTDSSGQVEFSLPEQGEYLVSLWHPLMDKLEYEPRTIDVGESNIIQLQTELVADDAFDMDDLESY